MADPNTVAQYIWRRARELGIDPNMALGIARYEGLNPNTLGSPTYGNPDAAGYSFGPFQLYSGSRDPSKIAPGGMAYDFLQKFGAPPSRDNWQQQVDFSLETMRDRGVKPWHAVRDQGGVDAITQKGARYASELGLLGDAPQASAVAQTAATVAPVAASTAPAATEKPVYSPDLWTQARILGNKVLPDVIEAPQPMTPEQITDMRADLAQGAGFMKSAQGLMSLASLLQPKEEPPPEPPQILPEERRRREFRPIARMRGLLG